LERIRKRVFHQIHPGPYSANRPLRSSDASGISVRHRNNVTAILRVFDFGPDEKAVIWPRIGPTRRSGSPHSLQTARIGLPGTSGRQLSRPQLRQSTRSWKRCERVIDKSRPTKVLRFPFQYRMSVVFALVLPRTESAIADRRTLQLPRGDLAGCEHGEASRGAARKAYATNSMRKRGELFRTTISPQSRRDLPLKI